MHATKVQEGVECYLYSYLAMALNGERTASLSGRFSLHCISSLVILQLRHSVCAAKYELNL